MSNAHINRFDDRGKGRIDRRRNPMLIALLASAVFAVRHYWAAHRAKA